MRHFLFNHMDRRQVYATYFVYFDADKGRAPNIGVRLSRQPL